MKVLLTTYRKANVCKVRTHLITRTNYTASYLIKNVSKDNENIKLCVFISVRCSKEG